MRRKRDSHGLRPLEKKHGRGGKEQRDGGEDKRVREKRGGHHEGGIAAAYTVRKGEDFELRRARAIALQLCGLLVRSLRNRIGLTPPPSG